MVVKIILIKKIVKIAIADGAIAELSQNKFGSKGTLLKIKQSVVEKESKQITLLFLIKEQTVKFKTH